MTRCPSGRVQRMIMSLLYRFFMACVPSAMCRLHAEETRMNDALYRARAA